MKTKTKMVALVEIASVLCLVFFVLISAIAADQNQEMQKVSTNTITTASEDDFVLGIYGNANEDDTIDMRDLTYVKLIFFGKKPETELADAKYDGKINPLDFIQIKLIIVDKEKELTYVDLFGVMATVHKPIKRLVVFSHSAGEVMRALNVQEDVVGVDKIICDEKLYFPELSKLPMVGSWHVPDYEAILNQNPDAVITFIPQAGYWATKKAEWNEKLPGVNIIALGFVNPPTGEKYTDIDKYNDLIQSTRKLGYILDKEDEAEEFCDWYEGYFNTIKSQTDELSEDEKPRVFMEWLRNYKFAKITRAIRIYDVAGGIDICADAGLPSGQVDHEWVIEQNPDIIVKHVYLYYTPCGYEVDEPSELIAAREEILNRPELAAVSAVTNNRVYILAEPECINGPGSLFGIAYCAKWFHPDLFEDLDPEAIHQEYLDRFQHVDYDLDEHGVFVYPPIEINGGLAGIPDKYKGQI